MIDDDVMDAFRNSGFTDSPESVNRTDKKLLTLTRQLVDRIFALTKADCAYLGIPYPMPRGWKKMIEGRVVNAASLSPGVRQRMQSESRSPSARDGEGKKIKPATAAQIDYLEILGMPRAEAEMLTLAAARREIDVWRRKPTPKQLQYARSLGATRQELDAFDRSTIGAFIERQKGTRARDR